jgi:cytosine/creatinine deaminase
VGSNVGSVTEGDTAHVPSHQRDVVLTGAARPAGAPVDVRLSAGRITAVAPAGTFPADPGAEHLDLAGYLLLPAPAEPHAHLDKALTADRAGNPGGDLAGAIDAWHRIDATVDHQDLVRRATDAALLGLAHGATAVRSHVNLGAGSGLRNLAALVEVRAALRGRVDVQLVAFPPAPLAGPVGAPSRRLLREALAAGADIVGGCAWLDADPVAANDACLAIAAAAGVPVDLHVDETTDPAARSLRPLAESVLRAGFGPAVTASHCVSLGSQPDAAATAAIVAAAGIAVVCNPQTNLFLQARGAAVDPPRGLTALAVLRAAGVTVAAGGDNQRDPFNSLGRADPLEVAALLVAAGHLDPVAAYDAVSTGARAAMGLPAVDLVVGAPAELLAIRAASVAEAVAVASPDRVVIHRGRVVCRTRLDRRYPAGAIPVPDPLLPEHHPYADSQISARM